MQPFKYLEHTADCKFQAYGDSMEQAFENAALAMMNHLTPVDKIKSMVYKTINVKANQTDKLLYAFLEEFIFFIDTEGFIVGEIKSLTIDKTNEEYVLKAEVGGDTYKNYEVVGDIKAITYNDMFIEEKEGVWTVQVVIDI
ncbi:MAG: archease [Nanoarchaeota archaeon]|nr:archease [Nanoarchaeota archaeon]